MALNFQIPMPKSGADSLESGLKTGSEVMSRMMLTPAEIQQKQAEAQKATMLARLLGGGMDEGQAQSGAPNDQNTQIRRGLLMATASGFKPVEANGNLYLPNGVFKIGETKEETRKGEAQKSASVESMKSGAEAIDHYANADASISGLRQLMPNPRYKNIAGTAESYLMSAKPLGIPLGMVLQHAYPKEDQELYGKANSYIGQLQQSLAELFKGPYKNLVDGIVNNTKPSIRDSESIQTAKLDALDRVNKLGKTYQLKKDEYISKGLSPVMAAFKATQDVPKADIIKAADYQNYKEGQKSTGNKQPKTNAKGMVILYKDGKEYHLPPPLMRKALSEGFTLGN